MSGACAETSADAPRGSEVFNFAGGLDRFATDATTRANTRDARANVAFGSRMGRCRRAWCGQVVRSGDRCGGWLRRARGSRKRRANAIAPRASASFGLASGFKRWEIADYKNTIVREPVGGTDEGIYLETNFSGQSGTLAVRDYREIGVQGPVLLTLLRGSIDPKSGVCTTDAGRPIRQMSCKDADGGAFSRGDTRNKKR